MKSSPDQQKYSAEFLHRPLFLWSTPFVFLFFGLPVISKAFGASALEIGGLFSVVTGATLLLRPAIGWMLDRFGRKIFFVAALFMYALSMGLFAFAGSLSWLYAARLIQGIGSAFLWTAANTIIADVTAPSERGRALGRINEITSQGGLVGIFAAFFIMLSFPKAVSWEYAFIGFTILTFVSALLAWKTVPNTKPGRPIAQGKPIFSRQLYKLLVIVFITAVPAAMLSPIYLIYLQDKFTTDTSTLAWAFFPAGLATSFLSARLGAFSDRFGRAPMMAVGLAGAGFISLFMPHLPSLVWLAVLYTLSTILWDLFGPAETALVADLTGHEQQGMAYGLYDFVSNLGLTIGPVLGGLLYDTFGKGVPFYLNGVILMASAGLVFVLLRQPPLKKPEGVPLV